MDGFSRVRTMDRKRSIKKNRRGDLPLTILVIGVFGVCALAIFSFIYSSLQVNKAFIGVEVMENANIQIESQMNKEPMFERGCIRLGIVFYCRLIKSSKEKED